MRLLKLKGDDELSFAEIRDEIPKYGILSHTWGEDNEEVTFKDVVNGAAKSKAGYKKIQFCGRQAANDGLQYFWVDTCSIDKSSSAELSEAINSMFRWYHNANKCYVYLSDVLISDFDANDHVSQFELESALQKSRWFTRGWTIQELLAPKSVEFFSSDGTRLGDKRSLERQIHKITGISVEALRGHTLSQFSVPERMSWAEKRTTKRPEDSAYSLLGIFGVHMSQIYGEGKENAFNRLRKEIGYSPLAKLPNVKQAAFNSYEKQYESLCLANTRVEVLKEIRDWSHRDDDRPIFWLSGLAGTGKSTIARTVARENYDKNSLAASFFFSRGGGDLARADKFFPTIATQLAKRISALENHISMALENHDIPGLTLEDQWLHLILTPLSSLTANISPSRLLIVIDALDECEKEKSIGLLLRLLSRVKEITTVQLRVFITSRPETPLRLGFRKMPSILHHDLALDKISEDLVNRDILTFFRHEFSEIRDIFDIDSDNSDNSDDYEDSDDWPGEMKLKQLVDKSEGLFIYAATVCKFFKTNDQWPHEDLLSIFLPTNPTERNPRHHQSIPRESLFSELDKMYTQILEHSLVYLQNSQGRAKIVGEIRAIIATIAVASQPLSPIILGSLLNLDYKVVLQRLKHLRSVFSVPKDESSPIRLLHPSFRDFLFDHQRCTSDHFFMEERKVHETMFKQCIDILSKVLNRDICKINRPSIFVSDVKEDIIRRYLPPEVQYACKYWAQHVLDSEIELELFDNAKVHDFLRQHILHWIEALSWMGNLFDGIHALSSLESKIPTKNGPELFALVQDARRFTLQFRSAIEQAPLQVYTSGLIFAPRKSVIRKQFEQLTPKLLKRPPQTEEAWSAALQTLEGHSGSVTAVSFSPNGLEVASASVDSTIKLWNAHTGEERLTLRGHLDWSWAVTFSPDGLVLASASRDWTIKLWDRRTGKERQTLKGHSDGVRAVAFSPDNSVLASASDDMTLRLWDTRTGEMRQKLEGHSGWVSAVAFSLDGEKIASASRDRTIKLWNAHTGEEQQTLEGHLDWVRAVAFSPDGSVVASASGDKTVKLWDRRTGKERQTLKGHSDGVQAVAFSRDGLVIASASGDGTVKLWDARSGEMRQTFKGHSGRVNDVAFSPNRSVIASASEDGTVKLWDALLEEEQQTHKGHIDWVRAVTFSPDGSVVASASRDRTIKLWNAHSGEERYTLKGHLDWISAVAFSPDGSVVASASRDGTVKLWDAQSGKMRQTIEGHSDWVWAVAFSRDGLVASASRDKTIKLWDTSSGEERHTLRGHSGPICAIAFSSNGSVIASASRDNTIKLWDTRLGKELLTLTEHSDWVLDLAFPPGESVNGSVIASASRDKTVKLWDTISGEIRQTFKGHSDWVYTVAFSPDGLVLASASLDGTIKLWDVGSGEERQTLPVDLNIEELSFSDNGSHLNTNRGVIDISSSADSVLMSQSSSPALSVKEQWIIQGTEHLLWLPPDYRATTAAAFGKTISLGHASGRVSILEFTFSEDLWSHLDQH